MLARFGVGAAASPVPCPRPVRCSSCVHRATADFRRLLAVYQLLYILSGMKATRAKLFQNGGSQAVRLPAECRFPQGQREVIVRRVGRRVVLEPLDEWPDQFLRCLGTLSGELPRPKQLSISKLRDPFG